MDTETRRKRFTRTGYTAYSSMRERCNNENQKDYPNYGAKGIKCRLSWDEFREIYFRTEECENCGRKLEDLNRRLREGRTIHRVDSAGTTRRRTSRSGAGAATAATGNLSRTESATSAVTSSLSVHSDP